MSTQSLKSSYPYFCVCFYGWSRHRKFFKIEKADIKITISQFWKFKFFLPILPNKTTKKSHNKSNNYWKKFKLWVRQFTFLCVNNRFTNGAGKGVYQSLQKWRTTFNIDHARWGRARDAYNSRMWDHRSNINNNRMVFGSL